MELGRSGRSMTISAGAGGQALRATGSSTIDRKICSTDSKAIHHCRCPFAHARGWAARCRPTCSTCSGRLGGAAAAGRMMVRSPAAPSPVLFSGLLFADSGSGRTMELGRSARPTMMMMSASPGRGGGDGAARPTGSIDQTMANSQALTWCCSTRSGRW
jgi:hypothetical protein